MFRRVVAEEPPPLHDAISKTIATSLPSLEMERNRFQRAACAGATQSRIRDKIPSWASTKITLRCGTCGAEIKHVGYDPG
jgi:hypothetical protein